MLTAAHNMTTEPLPTTPLPTDDVITARRGSRTE